MLSCCLILGCSVSSFIYRRQERDRFQTPLFLLVTGIAITLGIGVHVHPNLIMLVLIPWALCFAMIISSLGHWVLRRCGRQRRKTMYEIDEKEILIRKYWSLHVLWPFPDWTTEDLQVRIPVSHFPSRPGYYETEGGSMPFGSHCSVRILTISQFHWYPNMIALCSYQANSPHLDFSTSQVLTKKGVALSTEQHLIRLAAQIVILPKERGTAPQTPWWPVPFPSIRVSHTI